MGAEPTEPRNYAVETRMRKSMPEGVRFRPGNPGRPKGSRNKLGEAFIQDLYADWQANGPEAIERVRRERPDVYLKVIASLLPQKLDISHVDSMSDDERLSRIQELAEQLSAVVNVVVN